MFSFLRADWQPWKPGRAAIVALNVQGILEARDAVLAGKRPCRGSNQLLKLFGGGPLPGSNCFFRGEAKEWSRGSEIQNRPGRAGLQRRRQYARIARKDLKLSGFAIDGAAATSGGARPVANPGDVRVPRQKSNRFR